MHSLWLKKLYHALFRDPASEHPELERRIDQHIVAMTRFAMLISLLFWPLIAVMGYMIQISVVKLSFVVVAAMGFTTSLLCFNMPRARTKVALIFFVIFPGVIALYVSKAFSHIVTVGEARSVLLEGVRYLQLTPEQFLDYVGMFDRLVSVNFFYALSLIFLTMSPLKFRHIALLAVPYVFYGIAAFSSAHRVYWMVIYFVVIGIGVAIKALTEFLVVESMRKRLSDEDEIKRMSRALVDKELELARDIQRSLPVPGRVNTEHFDIEFFLKPNAMVGGDWVALRKELDGSFWILIIDAVGKGIQAALVVHAIQSLWTAAGQTKLEPEAWIAQVNDTLMRMGQKSPHCVTLGLMHLRVDGATYWSAAHCPLLLLSEDGGVQTYHELHARGGMIGLTRDLRMTPRHVDLRSFEKAHLILCSDGLLSVLPRSRMREGAMPQLESAFVPTLAAMTADDDLAVVSIRFKRGRASRLRRDAG